MNDFRRIAFVDEPAIAGAQWWQDSLSKSEVSRRGVTIAVVGGLATVAFGACTALVGAIAAGTSSSASNEATENREALAMQKQFGWSFGAKSDTLPLGRFARDEVREVLERPLLIDARAGHPPRNAAYLPYYSGVLLEVGWLAPTSDAANFGTSNGNQTSDTTVHIPFREAYRSLERMALASSYRVGVALSKLLDATKQAVVVDLDGPDSVALAAGMAPRFTPVMMFQNWPHPEGVAQSHLTLAALLFFHAAFAEHESVRSVTAAPVFVLERGRLNALENPTEQFDNRYKVSLPPADTLRAQGIDTVYMVAEESTVRVDIHEMLTAYERAGIRVRLIRPSEFLPGGATTEKASTESAYLELENQRVMFGPEPTSFAASYNEGKGAPHGMARKWRLADLTPPPALPPAIGVVPVVVAGGIILGAAAAQRRGTWSRTLYGGGGG